MVFMTFKPKAAKNVKAEQVTEKTIEEISTTFFGTAAVVRDEGVLSLKIATLSGVLEAAVGDWVVRTDEGVVIMEDAEFTEKYERARSNKEA